MSVWMRIGLVVLSAVLVVLTFPPYGISYLALVAWMPLLLALTDVSWRAGGRLGLLHGLLCFGGTLCWLWNIFGVMAISLWMILALFPAVFGVAVALAQKQIKNRAVMLTVVPILWAGIEFFRCEVFTLRFPWITPGTGFEPGVLDAYVGVYGVSALILFVGAILAFGLGRAKLIGGAVGLLLLGSVLLWRSNYPGHVVKVAAVQSEDCYFNTYAEMTETIEPSVDVLLWPEYAISNDLMTSPKDLGVVNALLAAKNAEILITGSRTNLDDGEYHNTALTVGRMGEIGRHFKNRPVHFFHDGIPGTESAVIETPLGQIATPVCFDNDYESVVRKAVAGGAELLLVPSMDAVSWGERQHLQHAELFRHRAAENRRYMVVAATSGRTQAISPKGTVLTELPLMHGGVMIAEVRTLEGMTFYTRGGWLIGPVMMWSAGGLILVLIIVSIQSARSRKSALRSES